MENRSASPDAWPAFEHRSTAGYSGDCVSAAGVGTLAIHSVRGHAFLCGGGKGNRPAHSDAGRGPSLCDQPCGGRNSVPSRSQEGWRHGRLPLGCGKKKSATRNGVWTNRVERTLLSAAVDLGLVGSTTKSTAA